jgi:hypothetical protein
MRINSSRLTAHLLPVAGDGPHISIAPTNFIPVKTVPVGQSIAATDPNGNTSEFTGEPRSVRSAP